MSQLDWVRTLMMAFVEKFVCDLCRIDRLLVDHYLQRLQASRLCRFPISHAGEQYMASSPLIPLNHHLRSLVQRRHRWDQAAMSVSSKFARIPIGIELDPIELDFGNIRCVNQSEMK